MKGRARISVEAAAVLAFGFNENEVWSLQEQVFLGFFNSVRSHSRIGPHDLDLLNLAGCSTHSRVTGDFHFCGNAHQ